MAKLPYGARVLLWLLKTIYGIDPAIPLYQIHQVKRYSFLSRAEKLALLEKKRNENT